MLFVRNAFGQTRAISPKIKAWDRRDRFGNLMTGAATVAYTSQIFFSPSGSSVTFADSVISGNKAITLPVT